MRKTNHRPGWKDPRQVLWAIAVIGAALILLGASHILREFAGKDELIGYEAYLHARIADKGYSLTPWQDEMVTTQRTVRPTPYHFALHLAEQMMGLRIASIVLPLVVGIACIAALSWILVLLDRPLSESMITLFAFILSPAFLFIGSTVTPHGLALALLLLGAALFLTRRMWILSLLPWGILVFFDMFHLLVVIALMLACILAARKEKAHALAVGCVLTAGIFLARPPFFTPYHPIPLPLISGAISDFGGHVGFGIFLLILACIGIAHSWKHKKEFYPAYLLAALGVFAMARLGGIIAVYLMPLAAVFIAIALLELRERRWSIPMLRRLTFVLIICGLLFSAVSYMDRLASAGPDGALIDAALFLGEISSPSDIILTHPTYAPVVTAVAKRQVVLDSFQQDPWVRQDLHELFTSRDADHVLDTLETYDVSYLLIDREIDEETIWTGRNDGLLFVLRDGETFKKVLRTDSIEIWKVLR